MSMFRSLIQSATADPRHGQILTLVSLILLGHVHFGFGLPLWQPAVAVASALSVQALLARVLGFGFDWRSPLITACSLTLLLRADGPELIALAAGLAIASKAALRIDGRHFVNPAALGIAATVLLFPGAWISPGQWGVEGWLVIFAAGAGLAVTQSARRLEVPILYLVSWAVLLTIRALWLGDPLAIPLHQMTSGALVVFAFFMISDPMTAPWHPLARAGWVILAALAGFALQMSWIVTAGPIWGLLAVCWLVPILNRLLPAPRARWHAAHSPSQTEGATT